MLGKYVKETMTVEDKLPIIFTEASWDAENDLNQDVIASSAADQCAWRKFIVVYSTAKCTAENDDDDEGKYICNESNKYSNQ